MNSKQILAIVSTVGEPRGAMLNYDSAEAYEEAVTILEAVGCDVYRETSRAAGSVFESAYINPPDPDFPMLCEVRLLSPVGYVQRIDQDTRVSLTPEGKLALRVIEGGVAS